MSKVHSILQGINAKPRVLNLTPEKVYRCISQRHKSNSDRTKINRVSLLRAYYERDMRYIDI